MCVLVFFFLYIFVYCSICEFVYLWMCDCVCLYLCVCRLPSVCPDLRAALLYGTWVEISNLLLIPMLGAVLRREAYVCACGVCVC